MKYFKIEKNRILLVDEQEQMIGEVRFVMLPNNRVDINFVYVKPEYRGTGIASELMDYTYDHLKGNRKEITAGCPYAKRWIERYEKEEEMI